VGRDPASRKGVPALDEGRDKDVQLDRLSPEARAFAGDEVRLRSESASPEETGATGLAGAKPSKTDVPAGPAKARTVTSRPPRGTRRKSIPAPRVAPAPEPAAKEPPHVLIIGGGGTGGALAHDLALRGLRVTLVERRELTSGATGRHQGLLHSGARYVTSDRAAAIECSAENKILRRVAPGSFEENDGLFVAMTDEEADLEAQFLEACWQCAVPTRRIDRAQALRLVPGLNPDLRLAVQVSDATMDAMRLPLRFFATARRNGAEIRPFTEVVAVKRAGRSVRGVAVRDHATGRDYEIGADIVVNAAGPWAGKVAALAGVVVATAPSAGVMVSVRGRHANMVVNRLHSWGDGDLVVPQRQQTILGTSSWPVDDPDSLGVPADRAEAVLNEAATLLPALRGAEVRAVWTAVGPFIPADSTRHATGQTADMRCIDHALDTPQTRGFITLAGGTATTARAMAQVAADLVCRKLGIDRPCTTTEVTLLPHTAWYAR
jgi:glycerol-3-phosphate dehydrogenase